MGNTIVHKASSRGHANHGWLNAYHTFSFASYHDPSRMHFGVLRVLNDDTVAAGMGFGKHPHDNMEIITIPLSGDLEHQDDMGNKEIIRSGDIQVMSAGTGIYHSEYNPNKDKEVKLLQIWVFPNKKNVTPRYDQLTYNRDKAKNVLLQLLSPDPKDEGVWIHQKAWFHLGLLDKGVVINYTSKQQGNGVYIFVLEGDVNINGNELNKRDGIGITDLEQISITAASNAEILVMDVPMTIS